MDRIHDRHAGTLDGQLVSLDQADRVSVAISLPQEVALLPACQHANWMLVNLLARADGIVDRLIIQVPDRVPLASRVVPLADRTLDLRSALIAGAEAIDAVPVSHAEVGAIDRAAVHFVIGPGPAVSGAIRVHGERWWGGFTTGDIPGDGTSAIPLGPYVAAALAASEVFKAVRLLEYSSLNSIFYSVWTMTVGSAPNLDASWAGPHDVDGTTIAATLAGVGAVGSTWVHALWATVGLSGVALLADSDGRGVDTTNLNRCPIFGRQSVDKPKASEAAAICNDSDLDLRSHNGTVGSISPRPPLMVSAVDTNRSRQAVQSLYPPRLLAGSTHGLRAEVLRCDPNALTACIHCYNPVEPDGESDNDLRRRFLAMGPAERQEIADRLHLDIDEAIQWATDGTCGYAGDQIAAHLRPGPSSPEAFAVGFVSVMAGVMLAALTVQESIGDGPLTGTTCRALFQFFDPLNQVTNSPRKFARQESCSMCDPMTPAAEIWRTRFSSY